MDGVLCDGSNVGWGPHVAGTRLCDQCNVLASESHFGFFHIS